MEINQTIFRVVAKEYIYECSITAITELSIVARMKDFNIETIHDIGDRDKTWFETYIEAEAFVEKKKRIARQIEQLKKELQ